MAQFVTYQLPEREEGELDVPDGKWILSHLNNGVVIPDKASQDTVNGIGIVFNETRYPAMIPSYEQEFFALYLQDKDQGFWISWHDIHKSTVYKSTG